MGALKMQDRKMQDMKLADQTARHEIAGHEKAGQYEMENLYMLSFTVERQPFLHCCHHSNSGFTASYTNFAYSIVLLFHVLGLLLG